ncbi:hypothetical protein, variant [Microbotryum lychnidis-dioicae p1A1 Lamole]|uniref:Transcription factor CBF/NF-Y/archaeal histone domain-containing protein n=1 Tax=Microbotryum lychnidis-dioicae (strain p1A1 Lamole / MvSl-1064) TaxID=683840 RepID=U5HF40_USTV1|nr:hypothetical protein, variant [Microbotryum lychnidis-dioicae p1A1 Lamole]|eukprot:KDE03783.1 hypothetical protein, variant [Microbotryum lychnidis-dioicae p1A1 Lamole]
MADADQPTSKRPKRSNDARFPVARIKRLIQADEEVGKVAQATPVLVSKALELFLQQLVQALLQDSQARNVQKISAHTLKRVINTVPTFDFLSDLVQHVPDPIQAQDEASIVEGDQKPRTTAATSATATGSRSSARGGKPVARLADYATEDGSAEEAGAQDEDDEYDA